MSDEIEELSIALKQLALRATELRRELNLVTERISAIRSDIESLRKKVA